MYAYSLLCQIRIPIAYPQSELCVLKAIKLNVQIRLAFTDPAIIYLHHLQTTSNAMCACLLQWFLQ